MDDKVKHWLKAAHLATAFHAYAPPGASLVFEDNQFYVQNGQRRTPIGENVNVAHNWLLDAVSNTTIIEPSLSKSKKEKD